MACDWVAEAQGGTSKVTITLRHDLHHSTNEEVMTSMFPPDRSPATPAAEDTLLPGPAGRYAIASAYDRYAGVYDHLFGWVLQPGRELLARRLQAAPGERIVEFGVGSGLMLPLYPRHAAVLGIDLSEAMLARARVLVQRQGLANVTLQRVDAERNGLPSAAFEHVVLPYVYSVTPDPEGLIREAFRVCRPGGHIWVLNHFSGLGVWDWLERPLKPFARWIGFRSDFPFKTHVLDRGWAVDEVLPVNLFGLSRLVHVRKPLEAADGDAGLDAAAPGMGLAAAAHGDAGDTGRMDRRDGGRARDGDGARN